jgi:hypothetical protein
MATLHPTAPLTPSQEIDQDEYGRSIAYSVIVFTAQRQRAKYEHEVIHYLAAPLTPTRIVEAVSVISRYSVFSGHTAYGAKYRSRFYYYNLVPQGVQS